jgi:predicted ArsR family transcriptional regulator
VSTHVHGERWSTEVLLWIQSHPLRWRTLVHLCDGVIASPQDIARDIGVPVENVAYHVRQLCDRGMIRSVGTEKRRGRTAHMYAVTDSWIDDEDWYRLPASAKRAFLARNLGWIARALRAGAQHAGFDRRNSHLTYHRLRLTAAQWEDLARDMNDLHERIRTLPHREPGDPASSGEHIDTVVVLMQFEEREATEG